jgi:hypothetical protein
MACSETALAFNNMNVSVNKNFCLSDVLWYVAHSSIIETDRRFRGTYCLHCQEDRLNLQKNHPQVLLSREQQLPYNYYYGCLGFDSEKC